MESFLKVRLSNRLKTIAGLIEKGDLVADIGTDHALIPIYLVREGICPRVIASDLNKGPVEAALENIREAGVSGLIDVRLGFGLAKLEPGEVNTVVIAGMGGGTIRDILSEHPAVVARLSRLVLQPMNDEQVLREWLFENGWQITEEEMVLEEGKIYTIIKAQPGLVKEYSPEDLFFGPRLLEKRHPLLKDKIEKELAHKEKIFDHVTSHATQGAGRQLDRLKAEIDSYKRVLRWLLSVKR